MTIEDYISYFRMKAIRHVDIHHNPDTEDPGYAGEDERKFYVFETSEILGGIHSAVSEDPVLFLQVYEWSTSAPNLYDVKGNYTGGFIVAKKADPNISEEVQDAYTESEAIVRAILASMRVDYVTKERMMQCPFGSIDWNRVFVNPVENIWEGRFGWFVKFEFLWPSAGNDADVVEGAFDPIPYILWETDTEDYNNMTFVLAGPGTPIVLSTLFSS